ncbi:MAG: trigger factor [Bacteroidetes bacterium]|nr:trigger factor [Bacteroidota bacterium]MBS1974395.1 trigger factor [Bacteroidota bacterium]
MATVTRENISLLNDKITVKVEKEDYLPSFEKALKEYGKKANIPGFRKGMVPASLIKKMYGHSVFTDEVLRSVEKELTNYMQNEKLDIFAQPLPLPENDSRQIDMSKPSGYAFAFEVGLKPNFAIPDLPSEKLSRYDVQVTSEMINEEVERLQTRNGKMTEPEIVASDDNVLNVKFTECDENGKEVENGINKENSLLVKYFSESFRSNWIGKKKDDIVVAQLSKAFDEKEREWVLDDLGLSKNDAAAFDKYFKVTITKLGLIEKALLNEELFKAVYPSKEIKTEEDFRNAIKEEIRQYWGNQSRSQLQHSIYHILLDHTMIDFPESFLKRWMQASGEQQKSQEQVAEEFPHFSNQLKWTLIVDKIIQDNKIEVLPEDIKNLAKQQLLSYMQGQILDDQQPWIDDYANRMMKDRKFVEDAVHRIQANKVFEWAETQVRPEEKPITREEFVKLQEAHQHHQH